MGCLILAWGIPWLRVLLEGRSSLCGSHPGQVVLGAAGKEEEKSPAQAVPCEADPSSGGEARGSHPAWAGCPD